MEQHIVLQRLVTRDPTSDSCVPWLGGGRAAATTSTGGGAVVIPGSTTMVPWTTKPGEMTPQDRADDKAKHR